MANSSKLPPLNPRCVYNPAVLTGSLKKNQNLTCWAKWVANGTNISAQETREFLEMCLSNLPNQKRRAVCRSAECDTAENVDALLYELVSHELLRRLRLEPKFKPKLSDGLTPDMLAKIGNREFIFDVYLTQNASRTVVHRNLLPGDQHSSQLTKDVGDRARKIREKIKEKHNKYLKTRKPIILAVFLKDTWMHLSDVESALYGACRGDGWLEDCFPQEVMKFLGKAAQHCGVDALLDGATLPDGNGRPGCPGVSAVLACKWFDSSNHGRPGRLLHCMVLHHWKPDIPLPAGKFSQFPEIVWAPNNSKCYKLEVKGSERIAASFSGREELTFRNS